MYFLGRSITIIVSGVVRCCSVLDASSMLFVVHFGSKKFNNRASNFYGIWMF